MEKVIKDVPPCGGRLTDDIPSGNYVIALPEEIAGTSAKGNPYFRLDLMNKAGDIFPDVIIMVDSLIRLAKKGAYGEMSVASSGRNSDLHYVPLHEFAINVNGREISKMVALKGEAKPEVSLL